MALPIRPFNKPLHYLQYLLQKKNNLVYLKKHFLEVEVYCFAFIDLQKI